MRFHTPLSPIIYAKLLGSKLAGEYQPKITATGMLKGDGNGGVSAAVAGTDYDTASNIVSATAAMTPEQAAQTRQNIGADTPETVTEWLEAHVDPDTGYVIDDTLTIQGAAADAKATGDSIREIGSYFFKSYNLFNPNDPDIEENVELKNNGTTAEKTGFFASGFIPIKRGETICMNYPTGTYGLTSSIVFYDENKNRINYTTSVARLTDSRGYNYIRYTFAETGNSKYIRVTGYMANIPYIMYVYAAEMPSVYEPYMEKAVLTDEVSVDYTNIINVAVTKSQTNFIKANPKNLNDLSSMVVGVINNSSTNGDLDSSATNWRSTDFIKVEPSATYKLFVAGGNYYGVGFKGICYYDEHKNYKGHIIPAGGISTTIKLDTITIPATDAVYIRTSYPKSYVENPKSWFYTQIFKGNVWTNMYLACDTAERVQSAGLTPDFSKEYNCLFGKYAMWNGDSICAADNDNEGGWPCRIAKANGMYVKNYGISGGCIAENISGHHSVCGTLDTMISDFPDADYIIIEGGTNDADLLGDNGLGTFDADDFSSAYITALDKDTYSGALESIFYRLVTQMKGKHIGFLIPQKMGHTAVLVERRRAYFDRAIAICKKWGIPYLDLWNNYYFNWELSAHWDQNMTDAQNEAAGNLYVDGQHLTTTGYAIQSPIIAEWLKTI